MRRLFGVSVFLCGLLGSEAAQATVQIDVDLSSQTMHVSANGASYDWTVSTARFGYATPRGHYRVGRLEQMHYSHKYHMSPMPHSMFFAGGYAIHGTYETANLGRPASHGCIRIAPGNAALLYDLVREQGGDIHITGSAPSSHYARARRRHVAARHSGRSLGGAFGDGGETWQSGGPEALAYAPARQAGISARAGHIIDPIMRPDYWPQ
jgi:hypothetical protein